MATYTVKHKITGLFFGGFDEGNNVKWVDSHLAKTMPKDHASAQAQLLKIADRNVQNRPVPA